MNGEQLKRAREINGLTQAELADEIVTQAAIARIEQNLFVPSEELVRKLAARLNFPVQFFYETTTFDFPLGSLLFRCLRGLKSKDRAQIVQTAWAGYKIFDSMAKRLKLMSVSFPKISDKEIVSPTQILRNVLGIEPDKPIRNIINRLERAGVVIISIPLEISEHDGFSLWIENRPVIVLSRGKPGDRQRRTVVHEMMHLANHYSLSGNLDEMEKEAEELTNEFLLPSELIREEIKAPVTLSGLAELKPRWGVSVQSLLERSFELGIISANQRKYLWKQISINKWNRNEPHFIEPEKPRALQKMAELLYSEGGRVNYRKLAQDVNLPFSIVQTIMSAYQGYIHEETKPAGNILDFALREESLTEKDSGKDQTPNHNSVRVFKR